LWVVQRRIGSNAEEIKPESINPAIFESPDGGENVQLYLGHSSLCSAPQWYFFGDRRELNFPGSYAVQLVPSLMVPSEKCLLMGSLAIMRAETYEDKDRAMELSKMLRRLRAALKRERDTSPFPVGA
jgi:hypothetical protein